MGGIPAWGDVLAAALVGTERRPLPVPASTADDPALALLEAAGALTLYRRAGVAPVSGLELPPPAPRDHTPLVSPAAATRVADLLAFEGPARAESPVREIEGRVEVLVEWLTAAVAAGRRVPGELLPPLLDAGRRHRALRPSIVAAGGARARWLAAQRADWAYLIAEVAESDVDDPGVWEFGAIGRRVGCLTVARRRDPTAARDLLLSTWDGESAEDRAALLAALATGLSVADEALLERALDDRRKEVRIAAVELLARLPDSAYAARMAARATACVTVVGDRLDIVPPAACDRAMRRDGIAPKPPAGVGERAWWLEEIVTRAPLRTWGDPGAFLARRVPQGWSPVLRRGLARAAAGQRDMAWATALTGPLTAEVAAGGRPDDRLLLESLYDVVPPDALAGLAGTALRRGLAGATAIGVEHVLELCPRPWPPALADAVFAALEDVGDRKTATWRLAGLLELAGLRLPAGDHPRAEALAEVARVRLGPTPMVEMVERFATTLRFRHDMLEELA